MEKTRVELFDLIWRKPMTHLSRDFGLSDQGLRKICIKYGIPLPPRGYWARLQHGKKDPRPELLFSNHNPLISLPDESEIATREQTNLLRKLAKQSAREVTPIVREPNDLKDLRCIQTYQAILERIEKLERTTGEKYDPLNSSARSFPPRKVFDLAFFSSKEKQIPIYATIDNAIRAICIADVVIERLTELSIDVQLIPVRDSRICEMRAVKHGQYYEFRFWEPSTKTQRTKTFTNLEKLISGYEYGNDTVMIPRHVLSIQFNGRYNQHIMQDKMMCKLEQQIDRIVERIQTKLAEKLVEHQKHLEWEQDYERKKAIRKHNELVTKDRARQLEVAFAESVAFDKLIKLKRYLQMLSAEIDKLPEDQKNIGLSWMQMVKHERSSINPIATRLHAFKVLASPARNSSKEYWGLDYIEEEHDPDFEESYGEDKHFGF
jgi:hypothetical protein